MEILGEILFMAGETVLGIVLVAITCLGYGWIVKTTWEWINIIKQKHPEDVWLLWMFRVIAFFGYSVISIPFLVMLHFGFAVINDAFIRLGEISALFSIDVPWRLVR